MSLKEENARLRKEAGMWMQAALDLRKTAKQIADAAEFEARVAEWLTYDEVQDYTRDPCSGCQFAYDELVDCPQEREWCRLKMARLAVEEELDGR